MRRVLERRAAGNNPHRYPLGDAFTESQCLLAGKYYAGGKSILVSGACQGFFAGFFAGFLLCWSRVAENQRIQQPLNTSTIIL
jgi:hypothetical protein